MKVRGLTLGAGVAAAALIAAAAAPVSTTAPRPAAASAAVPASPRKPAPPAPAPRKPFRLFGPKAPKPFGGLLGVSDAEVRAQLGAPTSARAKGNVWIWTYRLPDCDLFVFLKAKPGKPVKMNGAASGPDRRGQRAVPVEACIAHALAAARARPRAPTPVSASPAPPVSASAARPRH